jgi:hypothetical protein
MLHHGEDVGHCTRLTELRQRPAARRRLSQTNWTGLAVPALLLNYFFAGTNTRVPRGAKEKGQTVLARVPNAQILFPQALKWANGAGPSRHCASQQKRSRRPRRSLHASGSKETGQQCEEYLPCLGGVGRRTHDLCCERKSRHREVLRATSVCAAWEHFSQNAILQPAFAERPRGRRCYGKCQGPVTLAGSVSCRTLQPQQAPPRRAPSALIRRNAVQRKGAVSVLLGTPATLLSGIDSP